ncbi:hypothetical protein SY83_19015 [Paenibacillus swuensis]|uniref:DUF1572 domain-containing protein n=1 Tax=Paenibacillus swuensis TaxID=1178515 RepID=A0A172TMI5_9BACL|nr:DUF1572 family protein [Paenibacillus swuensis]ANE48037.1 hypothetical protein SY83_19015 [Paenibacillus swuensis]
MKSTNDFETVFLKESIETFESMKKLGDRTLERLKEEHFNHVIDPESNSMEIIIQHMCGNMRSRWTNFLTTDGEKPDRNRDQEFVQGKRTKEELIAMWEQGWTLVFTTLRSLQPEDLLRTITIRGEAHTVIRAIQRQISHYGYHVGQMVFLGKHLLEDSWESLSVPRAGAPERNKQDR